MVNQMAYKTVHPDTKGRITLGALAKGISGFHVFTEASGRIVLEPFVEIPAREQWLFKNKAATEQLQKGLSDAVHGRVSSRGDFTQFANIEIE